MTGPGGHADGLPRRRPGGRTALTRERVLRAVRELLAEQGSAALSVDAVALRSGVHRSSVYRRWGTISGVVADLADQYGAESAAIATGSLVGDLDALARGLATRLTDDGAAVVRALLAWRDEDVEALLQNFWAERRAEVQRVLEVHGSAADAALVTRVLAGPVHYCALVERRPVDEATVSAAVRAALAAAGPSRG